MTVSQEPPWLAYPGLAFIALSTLMFEILLTRIFSATTWYHFAFVATSVAMFGMADRESTAVVTGTDTAGGAVDRTGFLTPKRSGFAAG